MLADRQAKGIRGTSIRPRSGVRDDPMAIFNQMVASPTSRSTGAR
jgi:hypothetical protein